MGPGRARATSSTADPSGGDGLRALLVSPYHGGSHAAWAEGLESHSTHTFDLLTLPDRFWKWRMHGGATTLARRFMKSPTRPDVIVATDMLDLTTFLALSRGVTADVPVLLYMHENQLTYPLPADGDTGPMRRQLGERDHHYAFVNFASMLAADRVAFNSAYHRDAWFAELPRFLRHFPEHNELGSVEGLRRKSIVLPVGIECPDHTPSDTAGKEREDERIEPEKPPLVIWNQRWEYDKNPSQMVRALQEAAERGAAFRIAICGQTFGTSPTPLADAPATFGERLVHCGFAPADDYRRLLDEALVTLSTADHEFFGIAVLEAMAHGTFALLPDRLSYPELLSGPEIGDATRRRSLYDSHETLVAGLVEAVREPGETRRMGAEMARNARTFDWRHVSARYDRLMEELVDHRQASPV